MTDFSLFGIIIPYKNYRTAQTDYRIGEVASPFTQANVTLPKN